jgi:RNA polymerase sigma-70 factor (ECF subfamily)
VSLTARELRERLEDLHESSYRWAVVCCGYDREEAREALQTSYLKVIDGRVRFDGEARLTTWFFGVVRLTARERRRRRAVRAGALRRWLGGRSVAPPAPSPEAVSTAAESRRRVQRLLSELSPRQQRLLHLVFYEELTIEEAALALGVTVGTARTHYERGKARLKRLLAEDEAPCANSEKTNGRSASSLRTATASASRSSTMSGALRRDRVDDASDPPGPPDWRC